MADKRACSVTGCGNKYAAKGYCHAHYARWKRHGDPLGGGTTIGAPTIQNVIHRRKWAHVDA